MAELGYSYFSKLANSGAMNDYLIVKTIKNHNHGDFFNLYPVTIGPFIRGKSSRLM